MTWTYGDSPGTDDADNRRDAVRFLIGDTDTNDQQTTDEEIAFALSQAGNDVYIAGSICAQSLAGKYARESDVKFEDVSDKTSDLHKHYLSLATTLREQGRRYGTKGLGRPVAGGISKSDVNNVNQDSDRVDPKFRQDQFANPPNEGDTWPTVT